MTSACDIIQNQHKLLYNKCHKCSKTQLRWDETRTANAKDAAPIAPEHAVPPTPLLAAEGRGERIVRVTVRSKERLGERKETDCAVRSVDVIIK